MKIAQLATPLVLLLSPGYLFESAKCSASRKRDLDLQPPAPLLRQVQNELSRTMTTYTYENVQRLRALWTNYREELNAALNLPYSRVEERLKVLETHWHALDRMVEPIENHVRLNLDFNDQMKNISLEIKATKTFLMETAMGIFVLCESWYFDTNVRQLIDLAGDINPLALIDYDGVLDQTEVLVDGNSVLIELACFAVFGNRHCHAPLTPSTQIPSEPMRMAVENRTIFTAGLIETLGEWGKAFEASSAYDLKEMDFHSEDSRLPDSGEIDFDIGDPSASDPMEMDSDGEEPIFFDTKEIAFDIEDSRVSDPKRMDFHICQQMTDVMSDRLRSDFTKTEMIRAEFDRLIPPVVMAPPEAPLEAPPVVPGGYFGWFRRLFG